MDDRNKLIEKLGELSAKAYMFGRMYHIDEVTELTKDINELIAKVFDYSPWHTGKPTEDGNYLVICELIEDNCIPKNRKYHVGIWKDNKWWDEYPYRTIRAYLGAKVIKWQKIDEGEE